MKTCLVCNRAKDVAMRAVKTDDGRVLSIRLCQECVDDEDTRLEAIRRVTGESIH